MVFGDSSVFGLHWHQPGGPYVIGALPGQRNRSRSPRDDNNPQALEAAAAVEIQGSTHCDRAVRPRLRALRFFSGGAKQGDGEGPRTSGSQSDVATRPWDWFKLRGNPIPLKSLASRKDHGAMVRIYPDGRRAVSWTAARLWQHTSTMAQWRGYTILPAQGAREGVVAVNRRSNKKSEDEDHLALRHHVLDLPKELSRR